MTHYIQHYIQFFNAYWQWKNVYFIIIFDVDDNDEEYSSQRACVLALWRPLPRIQSGKQTWKHQVKTSTEAEHCTRFFPTVFCLLLPVHPADWHLPAVTSTSTAPRISVRLNLLSTRADGLMTCACFLANAIVMAGYRFQLADYCSNGGASHRLTLACFHYIYLVWPYVYVHTYVFTTFYLRGNFSHWKNSNVTAC